MFIDKHFNALYCIFMDKGCLAFTEVSMDKDQLRNFLAGLCVATLISGSALVVSGCAPKASS